MIMKIKNIDNFFLGTNNMEFSKDFYSNILGHETKKAFPQNVLLTVKVGKKELAII